MPLYEYKCKSCGSSFEIIQKVNEMPIKKCIKCGGGLVKVISPPALQFKGNGWYVTDYAQKNNSDKEEKPIPEKKTGEKPGSPKDKKKEPSSSEQI